MLVGTALYIHLLAYAGLSLFIIYGLYVSMVVCIVYAYNLTWGGPEKCQKWGRAKRVLSHFCRNVRKSHGHLRVAHLSLNCFGRFSLNSALFIHSPCQTGSRPMSGRCSSWKNPPLEKTLPFTGAQNVWLQISNSEGGAQKNGYYQDVP